MNPWFTMWTRPRQTIRTLLHAKFKISMYSLAALYALQGFFYYANYDSAGISFPFYVILIGALILCPFLGFIWIHFSSWIFHFTGRWLEGKAPRSHLQVAIVWSKIPILINLFLWLVFLIAYPNYVFILDAGGLSSVFMNLCSLISSIWSLVLLIQSLREVQSFSISRSIFNIFLAWIIFSGLIIVLLFVFRYFYILVA